MRTKTIAMLWLSGMLFWNGPAVTAESVEKWGPFKGRFIDIDTSEPVPGAVAIAIWLRNVPNPVQGQQEFYDARVAVADANGEFEIARREPPFFSFGVEMPRFNYIAPGYVLWNLQEVWRKPGVTQMRKKTVLRSENQMRSTGVTATIPDEIVKKLTKEINSERGQMGLRPINLFSGEIR